MSIQHLIVTSIAAITITLSGALCAQTASSQAAAAAREQDRADVATDTANRQPAGTAEQYKHEKVDAATAADTKAHAYPTEANRAARDKAEAAATDAAGMARPADETGRR